ncbi:MAG: phenylalanine--tRNA ligase subunit alpha [Cytophagales bacterium]
MASQQSDEILRKITLLRKEVTDHPPGDVGADFKRKFFGGKSVFKELGQQMHLLSSDQRKSLGKQMNQLRDEVHARCASMVKPSQKQHSPAVDYDMTLPPMVDGLGSLHPLTLLQEKIVNVLSKIGYRLAEGPEIEPASVIFDGLNFPPDHPAMGMQDTFYILQNETKKHKMCLRSQTSSVQIHAMKAHKPPLSVMSIGRVFRRETISSRSHCMFHQVEGLCVDTHITLQHLKATLGYFVRAIFGNDVLFRLRPSYFPFTEPSFETDVRCRCQQGCDFCKQSGWVEIGGAGMVHPNVLKNCGLDPKKYTGMAFGMGIERMVMLRSHILDIRVFTENDVRFASQFTNISLV